MDDGGSKWVAPDWLHDWAIYRFITASDWRIAIFFILAGVVFLAWFFLALDCLIRNFEHRGQLTGKPHWDKFIWFVVLLTGVGAVVYYFKVRRHAPHI